jgi:hypothetical protein
MPLLKLDTTCLDSIVQHIVLCWLVNDQRDVPSQLISLFCIT